MIDAIFCAISHISKSKMALQIRHESEKSVCLCVNSCPLLSSEFLIIELQVTQLLINDYILSSTIMKVLIR